MSTSSIIWRHELDGELQRIWQMRLALRKDAFLAKQEREDIDEGLQALIDTLIDTKAKISL